MRSCHRDQAEAMAEATRAAQDGRDRCVWFVRGHSSPSTGWTVPPRFVVGLMQAGSPTDDATQIARVRAGRRA